MSVFTVYVRAFTNVGLQLFSAVVGCWLVDPVNHRLGRRGTIFLTTAVTCLASVWQGVTNSWPHLLVGPTTEKLYIIHQHYF